MAVSGTAAMLTSSFDIIADDQHVTCVRGHACVVLSHTMPRCLLWQLMLAAVDKEHSFNSSQHGAVPHALMFGQRFTVRLPATNNGVPRVVSQLSNEIEDLKFEIDILLAMRTLSWDGSDAAALHWERRFRYWNVDPHAVMTIDRSMLWRLRMLQAARSTERQKVDARTAAFAQRTLLPKLRQSFGDWRLAASHASELHFLLLQHDDVAHGYRDDDDDACDNQDDDGDDVTDHAWHYGEHVDVVCVEQVPWMKLVRTRSEHQGTTGRKGASGLQRLEMVHRDRNAMMRCLRFFETSAADWNVPSFALKDEFNEALLQHLQQAMDAMQFEMLDVHVADWQSGCRRNNDHHHGCDLLRVTARHVV